MDKNRRGLTTCIRQSVARKVRTPSEFKFQAGWTESQKVEDGMDEQIYVLNLRDEMHVSASCEWTVYRNWDNEQTERVAASWGVA